MIVGLFIAFGGLVLGGGILTVGDLNDTFTRKVEVSAVFEDVNGLQEGDNVWFSGVKVGTVDTVQTSGEPGIVIATRPGAGNGRPRGAAVDLVVGGGAGGGL